MLMHFLEHNEPVQRILDLWAILPTISLNSDGLKSAYTNATRNTYKHLWDSRPAACYMRVRVNTENADTSRLVSKNVSRSPVWPRILLNEKHLLYKF